MPPDRSPSQPALIRPEPYPDATSIRAIKDDLDESKPFKCSLSSCSRRARDRATIRNHIRVVHLGLRPYICAVGGCRDAFGKSEGLAKHLWKEHKQVKCWYRCKEIFNNKTEINNHVKEVHWKVECRYREERGCLERFFNNRLMEVHARGTHEVFSCNHSLCDQCFETAQSLHLHQRQHFANKCPLSGSGCTTTSTTAYNMKKHLLDVHGLLGCQMFGCAETFNVGEEGRKDLERHERGHRPITCREEHCDSRFNLKWREETHWSKVHGKAKRTKKQKGRMLVRRGAEKGGGAEFGKTPSPRFTREIGHRPAGTYNEQDSEDEESAEEREDDYTEEKEEDSVAGVNTNTFSLDQLESLYDHELMTIIKSNLDDQLKQYYITCLTGKVSNATLSCTACTLTTPGMDSQVRTHCIRLPIENPESHSFPLVSYPCSNCLHPSSNSFSAGLTTSCRINGYHSKTGWVPWNARNKKGVVDGRFRMEDEDWQRVDKGRGWGELSGREWRAILQDLVVDLNSAQRESAHREPVNEDQGEDEYADEGGNCSDGDKEDVDLDNSFATDFTTFSNIPHARSGSSKHHASPAPDASTSTGLSSRTPAKSKGGNARSTVVVNGSWRVNGKVVDIEGQARRRADRVAKRHEEKVKQPGGLKGIGIEGNDREQEEDQNDEKMDTDTESDSELSELSEDSAVEPQFVPAQPAQFEVVEDTVIRTIDARNQAADGSAYLQTEGAGGSRDNTMEERSLVVSRALDRHHDGGEDGDEVGCEDEEAGDYRGTPDGEPESDYSDEGFDVEDSEPMSHPTNHHASQSKGKGHADEYSHSPPAAAGPSRILEPTLPSASSGGSGSQSVSWVKVFRDATAGVSKERKSSGKKNAKDKGKGKAGKKVTNKMWRWGQVSESERRRAVDELKIMKEEEEADAVL